MLFKKLLLVGVFGIASFLTIDQASASSLSKTLIDRTSALIIPLQSKKLLDNPSLEPFVESGKGTFSLMYDQDSSVKGMGLRNVYIPHATPKQSLKDKELVCKRLIKASNSNNVKDLFTEYRPLSIFAADVRAVSIFSTARLGYDVLRRDYIDMVNLTGNDTVAKFYNSWKKDVAPLDLYPDDGVDANAYYTRTAKTREAHFFHFTSKVDKKNLIYTGDSSDIVGHEIWGHAHLDEMCPWFFDSESLELGGFHEGHADSVALSVGLSISPNARQTLLAETGGDLHKKQNFLSRLGEQFGAGFGIDSVRNLDVDAILGQVEQEVHDIGRIWASGIYDILAGAYPIAQKSLIGTKDEAHILDLCATYLRRLENLAILSQTKKEPGLGDIASMMNQFAQQKTALTGIKEIDTLSWGDFIKSEFTRRKIPTNGVQGKMKLFDIAFSKKKVGLCGTVHNHLCKTLHEKKS